MGARLAPPGGGAVVDPPAPAADVPESVQWNGQTLFAWPGADLLYAKGEEPRWCGGCGVELASHRHALCPACRRGRGIPAPAIRPRPDAPRVIGD